MSFIPGVPQNVKAAPENLSINLAWQPSAPALSLITTYTIKRSLVSGGPYTTIGSTTTTSYTDSGLTNNTPYYYVISASNTSGSSANSSEVYAVPQPVGLTNWQQENEGYVATGPSNSSMAICTESEVPIRILLNRIERARFQPGGHFKQFPLFPPNVPHDGDQWNDVVQGTFIDYPNHIKQARVGCVFTQLSQVTVANTTTEMSLTGTGVGTLRLPAHFFLPGKTVRMRAWGYYSATGTSDLTITFKIDNEIATVTVPTITAATNAVWRVDLDCTCLIEGPSGSLIAQGIFFHNDSQAGMPNIGPTVFDTTLTGHTDLTATWSVADPGNTITCTNLSYEVLN